MLAWRRCEHRRCCRRRSSFAAAALEDAVVLRVWVQRLRSKPRLHRQSKTLAHTKLAAVRYAHFPGMCRCFLAMLFSQSA